MTLTISGTGMDIPVVLEVPLSTLTVSFALPPGPKRFVLTIYTSFPGVILTAEVTADLTAGIDLNLEFPVVINAPPRVTLTASATTVNKGTAVQLTATATDPDGDPIASYAWSATGGTIAGSGATATFVPTVTGTTRPCVTVSDGGKGGSTTVCVDITAANRPPVVSRVSFSNASPKDGDTVTVSCAASDPDGDSLTYTWKITGAATGSRDTGSRNRFSYTFSTTGAHTFTCTATDPDGQSDSRAGSVTVAALFQGTIRAGTTTGYHEELQLVLPSGTGSVTLTCTGNTPFGLNVWDGDNIGGCANGMVADGGSQGTTQTATWNAGHLTTYYPIVYNPYLSPQLNYSCSVSVSPSTLTLLYDDTTRGCW